MKIGRLMTLALQYLEVDVELNTTKFTIADLEANDRFKEYINNMEHSIEMGLMRFSSSLILPIQEVEVSGATLLQNNRIVYLRLDATKESIAHKVSNIYKITARGELIGNIKYNIIGNKIIIKDIILNDDTYFIVYHPRMFDLEKYRAENQEVYDVDLSNLTIHDGKLGDIMVSVPDEMALVIKYLIYSDLKLEENPNLANINKNYFESYLSENATLQVISHETEVKGGNYNDDIPSYNYGLDPLNLGDDD